MPRGGKREKLGRKSNRRKRLSDIKTQHGTDLRGYHGLLEQMIIITLKLLSFLRKLLIVFFEEGVLDSKTQ